MFLLNFAELMLVVFVTLILLGKDKAMEMYRVVISKK